MKIDIKKIKILKDLKRFFWFLGQNLFLSCLAFFFLALIFGAFIFYKYSIWLPKKEISVFQDFSPFQRNVYENILKTWQQKEEKFKEADSKEYLNPFKKKGSAEESEEGE